MSTTREAAERVVLDTFKNDPSWTNTELINAIDEALQAERERAAKIAGTHDFRHSSGYRCEQGFAIAQKIREGKPQE